MNIIIKNVEMALNNSELKEYLKGTGVYRIPSRDGFFSDFSVALYSGIYGYYNIYPEKEINIFFEKEIVNMMNGNNFETMCAFEYYWRQIVCEERKTAPFNLSERCIINVKKAISAKKSILSTYKEYPEFGSSLGNGAYQYAQNVATMINKEYWREIL